VKHLKTTIGDIQCKEIITGVTHAQLDPDLFEYLDGFIVRGVIISDTML
jgi:hypothetical protein